MAYMKNFAVVGGAGFIGSHLLDHLAAEGNKITVIDNLSSGTISRISKHLKQPYFNYINADAKDTPILIKAFQGIDTVVHLASNPDIAKAETYPRIDFLQGTAITESVLEALRIAKVQNILYASGSGVYAESEFKPLTEESPLQPISTYGASKLAGESLLSSYCYMFGIKGIAFRFANVVGARQTHGVGFDFLNKLNHDSTSLTVLGNGNQTKSYIHVDDIVAALLIANKKIDNGYSVFNVSTEDYLSVKEIAELAIAVFNLDQSKTKIDFGTEERGWKADIPKILLNSDKIRSIGWKSTFTSYDAMLRALTDMKKELIQ